jgi:uncharacterized protein
MTSLPEDRDPWNHPEEATAATSPTGDWVPPAIRPPTDGAYAPWGSEAPREPLPLEEQQRLQPFEPAPPPRIPNFGHLCILGLLLSVGLLCTSLIVSVSLRHHLFGVSTKEQAISNIHYTLGSEGLLYLFTLAACMIVFPLVWHKGFFAGVQWNFTTALRLRWRLVSAAGACFLLAFIDSVLVPGPSNAPIDKIFREPGAAWLLFGFGITFAPFFEEMFFRGFLLPTLCTAYDWFDERIKHRPQLPLAENGHPQWTVPAMIFGAILTSIPFAALHAQQTGYSWGPFVLLVGVSLVLCAIRLSTRSLACSTLVHSSYNFILFVFMLVGTHGFKHLGNM